MRTQQRTTDAVPAVAESRPEDHRTTYLWLDAGQSWPFLRGSETIGNRALYGWVFVVAACACWAMIMMVTGGPRPLDATVQMERLAQKLDRTTAIPPETAIGLARLIGQPGYDCRHVACRAELAVRNEAARTRLQQLLASKGTANEIVMSANRWQQ
jgi:hypothetical protein